MKLQAEELLSLASCALHSRTLTTLPVLYPLHLTVTASPLVRFLVGVAVARRCSTGGGTVVMVAFDPAWGVNVTLVTPGAASLERSANTDLSPDK